MQKKMTCASNSWNIDNDTLCDEFTLFLVQTPFFLHRGDGVQGTIQVNRKTSCYITQEDLHQPLVTVEEMMKVACKLKLKPGSDHKSVIDEVLSNLHLDHCRNVMADRLSGGERKRLSVALELVSNPGIFFLDEPTSGLDEVTAAQCIRQLRDLAKQDRTVVCTIHQPSAAIFALFDHIYIIAQGQCVYQGAPKALVPFLAQVNINCPRHYNPADFSKFFLFMLPFKNINT